jgi:hypothetical protein
MAASTKSGVVRSIIGHKQHGPSIQWEIRWSCIAEGVTRACIVIGLEGVKRLVANDVKSGG